MRKKTFIMILDRLVWALIALLPILAFLLVPFGYSIQGNEVNLSLPLFADVISQFGMNEDNFLYQTFVDLFGADGVIHFFDVDSPILLYFSYFVIVEIFHLFIDFILFIPKLCHKWMDKLTNGVELSKEGY